MPIRTEETSWMRLFVDQLILMMTMTWINENLHRHLSSSLHSGQSAHHSKCLQWACEHHNWTAEQGNEVANLMYHVDVKETGACVSFTQGKWWHQDVL